MKCLQILTILLVQAGFSSGQDFRVEKRDSFVKVISSMKDDSNKVNALMHYGWWFETYNMDSAAKCYKQMHLLSRKLDYTSGDLQYYANYTFVLNQRGKYAESLKLNLESVALAKKKGTKEQIAICLFNVGSSYNNMAKYQPALRYYLKSVKIFESLKLKKNTAIAYDNIGGVFSNIGQPKKGLGYHLKAIDVAKEAGDSLEIASASLNAGMQLSKLNELKRAAKYVYSCLRISKEIKSTFLEINANLTLAEIFIKQNQVAKALDYAQRGRVDAAKIDSKYSEMEALKLLTRCYSLQRNTDKTIELGEETVAFGKKNKIVTDLRTIYQVLSLAYVKEGNYESGYKNLIIAKNISDSTNQKEITKEIEELELNYQTAKKEKQILELKQIEKKQQLLIGGLVIGLLVLFIISSLIYKNYHQKRRLLIADALLQEQKINELETEKQLLATQSVLQGQEEERKRLAKDLHDGLGSILSGTKFSFNSIRDHLTIGPESATAFDRSIGLLDQSIQELRRVAHNMMPEALIRFGLDSALNDFCNNINQNSDLHLTYQSFDLKDDMISSEKAGAIYRIIQELVNNILKHAKATEALVQLVKKEDVLSITVEDNGVGFDPMILQDNSGMGYQNLYNRVAYIGGKMDLQAEIGSGTSIIIEIPTEA